MSGTGSGGSYLERQLGELIREVTRLSTKMEDIPTRHEWQMLVARLTAVEEWQRSVDRQGASSTARYALWVSMLTLISMVIFGILQATVV